MLPDIDAFATSRAQSFINGTRQTARIKDISGVARFTIGAGRKSLPRARLLESRGRRIVCNLSTFAAQKPHRQHQFQV